jgi:outer membrane protein TolC
MNRTSQTRFISLLLIGGLVLAVPLLLRPLFAQERSLDGDVEKILRERLSVLEEAARLSREAYRAGQTDFHGTLAAEQAVLEARLELAGTKEERVKIREEVLKNAESLEKATEELFKAKEASHINLLSARASRLRAAADLMLERKGMGR